MEEIIRFPRPRGLTHQATAYRNKTIRKGDFIGFIMNLYHSNLLLYPYPKDSSVGTQEGQFQTKAQALNNKQKTKSKNNKQTNNQYHSTGGRGLRGIEIGELATFLQCSAKRAKEYILTSIIKEGQGLLERTMLRDELGTSRATLRALKNGLLTRHSTVSAWENELLAETRARNYSAGLVKEVNASMRLTNDTLKDLINLHQHTVAQLEKGTVHHGPQHGSEPYLEIDGPVHEKGHILTTEVAIKLLEERGLSGTQAVDLEALKDKYLTDPNIPNVVANLSDAQGVAKASIKLQSPEAQMDHENRREITEGFEVVDGTEPE